MKKVAIGVGLLLALGIACFVLASHYFTVSVEFPIGTKLEDALADVSDRRLHFSILKEKNKERIDHYGHQSIYEIAQIDPKDVENVVRVVTPAFMIGSDIVYLFFDRNDELIGRISMYSESRLVF